MRVKPGDIDGSGALLSGSSVDLNLSGDLNNQGGTIAGRTTVALTADNIHNLAGRITGKDVALVAGTDLNNIGGMIDAQHSLAAIAGRNVNIVTTTSDASSRATTARGSIAQQRTVIDRVAELYVSDPGGSLAVYAGGDIHTAGAQITSGGSVELSARGDVNLDSVTTGQSESIRWSSRNSRIDGSSSETGTTVSGGTNVAISAGGDLTARAATLSAGNDLSLDAGGKLLLYAGQNQTYAQTEHSQRSGMSYNRLDASSSETTLARTTLSADNVKLHSGGDTTLGAVKVDANTLDLQAGGQLNLLTQTTSSNKSRSESSSASVKKSGLAGSIGGIPVPMGAGSRDATTSYSDTAAASSITSTNGGVLLQGDGAALLQGVKVDATKDTTTRPSVFPHKPDPAATFRANAAGVPEAIKRGAVRATVGARFPLVQVADAHRVAEGRAAAGTIVLLPQSRPNSTTTGWWSDTRVWRSTSMRRTCGARLSLTKTKSQATGSGP